MAEITREHLELAALAAGMISAEFAGNANYLDGALDRWRPRLDDGDAARLQVLMNMDIAAYKATITATVDGWDDWASVAHDGTEPDKLRAWREAVVLCAAAVGAKMKGGA